MLAPIATKVMMKMARPRRPVAARVLPRYARWWHAWRYGGMAVCPVASPACPAASWHAADDRRGFKGKTIDAKARRRRALGHRSCDCQTASDSSVFRIYGPVPGVRMTMDESGGSSGGDLLIEDEMGESSSPRDERVGGSSAARHPRRPQAGASAHPLDARSESGSGQQVQEVGQDRRPVHGNYHPHGDSAVYDAMVRMAQSFAALSLVDGQGNFGSIDGDAATYRYTEARMTKMAAEVLDDIQYDTVDMRDNFDGSRQEPILPSRLPNLLVNGSSGIAVGMATNIPPHSLAEVCKAAHHLIDHPGATVDDLMRFVKAPDFPTGGLICGTGGVRRAYETGAVASSCAPASTRRRCGAQPGGHRDPLRHQARDHRPVHRQGGARRPYHRHLGRMAVR